MLALRKANWGSEYETRWLMATIIEHDLYHAGEINHIRALAQGDDAWPSTNQGPALSFQHDVALESHQQQKTDQDRPISPQ